MQQAKKPLRPVLKPPVIPSPATSSSSAPVVSEPVDFQRRHQETGYNGALIFSLREAIAANKRLISELEKQLKVEQDKTNFKPS